MNGPEHLREGKRLLADSCASSLSFQPEECQILAAQAQAHFLAALVAIEIEDKLPDRVSWQEAADS